jgi:hypothetical protein
MLYTYWAHYARLISVSVAAADISEQFRLKSTAR